MEEEKVILVDTKDNPIGIMPKMEAHQKALLHRAFSVFIINQKGELMLQQRALDKYHSPGLWTNTCCSHQREGGGAEQKMIHHQPAPNKKWVGGIDGRRTDQNRIKKPGSQNQLI